jgi:hypothetical protein
MAGKLGKEKLMVISLILCIVNIVLVISAAFVPWVTLDAQTGVGGIADLDLEADFYQAWVTYDATASNINTGALGGIAGGMIPGVGELSPEGNITQSETIVYYEGLGKFQNLIGLFFGTTKDANYFINPQTDNFDNTRVDVNTHTDIIPWWPENMEQEISVSVKLNVSDGVKHIRINEVWIDVWRNWDEGDRKYTSKVSRVWETKPGDLLINEDDEKVYKHGIAIKKDWGEKVGIIAMVDITMTDIYDAEDEGIQLRPFVSTSHPQEMVNIIPITQGQFISVILMFIALPMTIIGIILTIVAIIMTFLQRRRRLHVMFTAAVFNWLSVLFFYNGITTLIDLIGFIKDEWVIWNSLGLMLPIIAGTMLIIVIILELKFGEKKPVAEPKQEEEIKFDISSAISAEAAEEDDEEEEDEDEDEVFVCPDCEKEFSEVVSECPNCGAEFSGLDDEEEEEEGEEEEREVEDFEEPPPPPSKPKKSKPLPPKTEKAKPLPPKKEKTKPPPPPPPKPKKGKKK